MDITPKNSSPADEQKNSINGEALAKIIGIVLYGVSSFAVLALSIPVAGNLLPMWVAVLLLAGMAAMAVYGESGYFVLSQGIITAILCAFCVHLYYVVLDGGALALGLFLSMIVSIFTAVNNDDW